MAREETRFPFPGAREGVHNFVFLGEAGGGKSEIALNLALALKEREDWPVHFFDLDMTKPLFRSRDQARFLADRGVEFHYEEQFMDAPTVAGGVSRLLADRSQITVLDVGGDYMGARSVGGYAPFLNREETWVGYVINPYRPWSMDLEHIDLVLGETLGVSHVELERLRLVGNPNLGPGTTARDVLEGIRRLEETVAPHKPVDLYCLKEELLPQVAGETRAPLFPISLYLTYEWEREGSDPVL